MKFTILTLFPEILRAFFEASLMAKAVSRGIIEYDLLNIRDFATDKHKTCDDKPYGGGAGQLLLAEPLGAALESVGAKKKYVVCVTPSGKPFSQKKACDFSHLGEIVIICGRYEGIDQRILDLYVDEEISIGDFVTSSGEVAALAIVDAVYRLVGDVISSESLVEESFSGGLLEYPQYTRPPIYNGLQVPEVLLGGNHELIRKWRLKKRIEKTLLNRPELIFLAREKGFLSLEMENLIEEITDGVSLKKIRKNRKRKKSSAKK